MAVVISLDAGTTGVRAVAVGEDGRIRGSRYREFPQYFPRPGWVEHDPEEIWDAAVGTLSDLLSALSAAGAGAGASGTAAGARGGVAVAAIGITDQRETTVVWDRDTGAALHRAIVWQDRRTAGRCAELEAAGHLKMIRAKTGLVLDPYFSATKMRWLLDHGQFRAGAGLGFGTVDSWLLWKLTGGAVYATDATNAARTMLLDIGTARWDDDLTALFEIPISALPEVRPSSGRIAVTAAGAVPGLEGGIPISGIAGDQQAALFGQACFRPGMTKNTYGTGSFVLMNLGYSCPQPAAGLLTTIAWVLDGDDPVYAFEGSIFVTGAAVQWLRDGLGLVAESKEVGPLAESVPDSGGAYVVPALTGLGSPWWDPAARGTIVGLTRGVGRAQLARAVVESMAFQTRDVVDSMVGACGQPLTELRVDGGASVMDLLMRIQADVLGVPVVRAAVQETTALGAAFLAGLAEGVWDSTEEIAATWGSDATFRPADDLDLTNLAYDGWRRAVGRSRGWASP
jgi:glycerol kinase